MAPSKTKTVKNKFAGPKRSGTDGVAKKKPGAKAPAKQVTKSSLKPQLDKKKKKKVYTAEELGIPKLNGIRPADVAKPKGQKKGKVFVDDPVCHLQACVHTHCALVFLPNAPSSAEPEYGFG